MNDKLQRVTDSGPPASRRHASRVRRVLHAIRSSWSGPITSNSPEFAKWWGIPDSSTGITVNADTALNYSAVWNAVGLIAAQIANLPLVLYQKANGGRDKQPYKAHPLYRIVHDRSNPETSAFYVRETMQAHVLL